MMSFAATPREVQEAQALTCGMMSAIDDAVGRVLLSLDRTATDRETVVIFTSDHGDYLGEHRLLLKGAPQYRSILRVPLIWSDPRGVRRPPWCDSMTSSMDLSATILDRARIQPYPGCRASASCLRWQEIPQRPRACRRPVRAPEGAGGIHCAAAHPFAGDAALAPQRSAGRELGRALRFRGGSWRIREPVGHAGARAHEMRVDGATGREEIALVDSVPLATGMA